ncbi:A disintegrin and metalloproteinase with thrombospondin motifs 9-like [Physella acuta]|uniref:A disintegrin and metalloproteinase with thrombospondin motifs 9-like n=1 Tax=Physella acuta TaxID=109671 RepID=UPI0027DE98FF|nr:A disintegrin and metalloproteinase with thrombospondin motifs 9-like [Physella acuta]
MSVVRCHEMKLLEVAPDMLNSFESRPARNHGVPNPLASTLKTSVLSETPNVFRDASGYLVYDDRKGTAYPSYAERHLAKDWIIPSSSNTDDGSVKTDYVRSSEKSPDDLKLRQSPNESDSNVNHFQSWEGFSSSEDFENRPLMLTVNAPGVFERAVTLVLSHVSEFLSPGFVIQRVQGNVSWLEEVQEPGVDCYYSGIVLEHPDESNVAISICDGVRGVIQLQGDKFIIEPVKNVSVPSTSGANASKVPSVFALYSLQQKTHTISKLSAQNAHSPSNCSITENFKHHRLKPLLEKLAILNNRVYSTKYEQYKNRGKGQGDRVWKNGGKNARGRRKRSVGISEKHTVETLVVADSKMYQHHGEDLKHYVLTLMSVVKNIYQHPSIGNYINVVVVRLIIFESSWETPFKVSTNAASMLKDFCQWQKTINSVENHHDTAILITREDICRAVGKCDTLGLAELGTICDINRSCSLIEDNGISAAFTIAHELGHVFNLPHDDDKQCTELLPEDQKSAFHVMAPTLDYNASPWDWSICSSRLITEFIEAGYAHCLLDGNKVKTYTHSLKDFKEPGWTYSADKQCELVFGPNFVICPQSMTLHHPVCRRLWCTPSNGTDTGCRTKHMPWADGTPCGEGKICMQGSCKQVPESKPKAINGGWGNWSAFGGCSRTCGGGVKTKYRECTNPVPQNGGKYCLGFREKFKSCNIKPCDENAQDFREAQCESDVMRKKFEYHDSAANSTWKPKFSGVYTRFACRLYCNAQKNSTLTQLSKNVIDGTKCGEYTDDICINGRCWAVGCDNRLGSSVKRDSCGICGGDDMTCRTVTGTFNNAIYGYNYIATIPSGATAIKIIQYGPYGNSRLFIDDDNYLALQDSQNRYILNGEFLVRTDLFKVKVKGAQLEYTGCGKTVENITTNMIIGEDIKLFVLSVGKMNPPNITYSYRISVTKKVVWKNKDWSKCSAVCNGERRSIARCVREEDDHIVTPNMCKDLVRPPRVTEHCNTDCTVSWRVLSKEECPVRCGTGMRYQAVHCIKQVGFKTAEIVNDKECVRLHGVKPDAYVPCEGKCLATYWTYTDWSQCSTSCGEGLQTRQAKCVDESGREHSDTECDGKEKTLSRVCKSEECADWSTGNWLGCSVTCGNGYKQRKVWCDQAGQKVDEAKCSKKKPYSKKDCNLQECHEWFPGGWGPCSVTCDRGISMRAVKCRVGEKLQDDSFCDSSLKPDDTRQCYMGACPTPKPKPTITSQAVGAYWKFGSWTECSATCGSGKKQRAVSCQDNNGNKVNENQCSHLTKPESVDNCMLKPCGEWHYGVWSDCSVTCGDGIQTRFLTCTFNQQHQDVKFCDITTKPETEIRCNRGTCIGVDDLSIAVITSNKVVGTHHWRVGSWSACSTTCGSGWERRVVLCRDERGPSEECDRKVKPDEFRSCNNGECPKWTAYTWSNCSAVKCNEEGQQSRLVVCQLHNGDIIANSYCDQRSKLSETQDCKGPCDQSTEGTWKKGQWSACSVSCGEGYRRRHMICVNSEDEEISESHCGNKTNTLKKCVENCHTWHTGNWSKCSAKCGMGEQRRELQCQDSMQKVVSKSLCEHLPKPATSSPCSIKECPLFKWVPAAWSECSKTCGFGRKHRSVTCVDMNSTRVSSHLCDNEGKPKVMRRCNEFPCPYMWNTGPWSECSSTCGEGKQLRTVVCQAVTKEGWILPGEVLYGCRPEEKPSTARYCSYGDCNAKSHWTVGSWSKCSADCGNGKQFRQVTCVDKDRHKTQRNNCLPLFKPVRTRPCNNGHCYATSCREFKKLTTIRKDGDYQLKIGDQLIKIYCKDMQKKHPKEYISLKQGPGENYSEMFDKKLKTPNTCPFNGLRPDVDCPECLKKPYEQSGNTSFSKIRIDLSTLTIIPTDAEFSSTHMGSFVPFATAGDCYSSSNCPQGRFSINLVDTGFIVSVNTTWNLQGNRASQRIWRLRDGQIIRGVCGGYCGKCSTDLSIGLKLEVLK